MKKGVRFLVLLTYGYFQVLRNRIQCAFFYSSRHSVPPHMINCFCTVGPTLLLASEQCLAQPYS